MINFLTSGGHLYSIDDIQYFLHTENLVSNQSIKIDPTSPLAEKLLTQETLEKIQKKQYHFQGIEWDDNTKLTPYYDASSLLLPFLTIPTYYFAEVFSANPINMVGFFTNSIILSLTSLMVFLVAKHFLKSKLIPFLLSLVFMTTTFVWAYNTGMMLRPLASLLTIVGFYLIISSDQNSKIKIFCAGLSIGAIILASSSTIIIIPGLVIFGIFYFRSQRKQVLLFVVGVLIMFFIQAELNYYRFDSITDFGFGNQQNIFTHSHSEGIFGYMFSLGWGVFFNAPILILFPPSIYFIYKKNKSLAILLSYLFIITWIFHGTEPSPHWSGYGGWGPRYFITILPLLVISTGFLFKELSHNKILIISSIGLGVFGFFVNLMGKLVWYMYGYSYGWSVLKTHIINDGWLQLNYNIFYSPLSLHLQTLNSNYIQEMGKPTTGARSWGLAPCPYDFFVYCEAGIIPFILMIMSLCIVGFLILNNLNIINFKGVIFGKTK